jgi:hypothetical protein
MAALPKSLTGKRSVRGAGIKPDAKIVLSIQINKGGSHEEYDDSGERFLIESMTFQ